jgi:hypothetical protein
LQKYRSLGGEKPKAILCASSAEVCGPHQSDQKAALSRIGRANFGLVPDFIDRRSDVAPICVAAHICCLAMLVQRLSARFDGRRA